jgi:predicted RecB family nuclease
VTLRGIGAENAARLREAGVESLEELAAVSPEELAVRLSVRGPWVSSARVRVWVRAARTVVEREAVPQDRLRVP